MTSNANESDDGETMLAFSILNPGDERGELTRIAKPKPDPGFALVRVLRAGVCNTDLEILKGYMGFRGVLGHEFVGRVESVNTDGLDNDSAAAAAEAEAAAWVGKRVCGDINVGCSSCRICRNDDDLDGRGGCPNMSRNHCPNRTVLGILNKNGTMAEYLTLPITNLHEVPDGVPDEVAVFAEPLAAACRIVEQGLVRYDGTNPDRVAILGDGKLGLMIAEVLGRAHASHFPEAVGEESPPEPILFGKHRHKLDLVKDSGVDTRDVSDCIDESAFNGVSADHAAKYDMVVDATGNPAGLSLAAGLCRPMGTLVLKSTCAAGEKFNASPFVVDELRVVGSRCGPIDRALDLLALKEEVSETKIDIDKRPLRVEKYITKFFPLSEAAEAIRCAGEKSTMKVQIVCSKE